MQASFHWNDNETIDADRQPYSLKPCLTVIPAKAGIQEDNDGVPRKLRFNQSFHKQTRIPAIIPRICFRIFAALLRYPWRVVAPV